MIFRTIDVQAWPQGGLDCGLFCDYATNTVTAEPDSIVIGGQLQRSPKGDLPVEIQEGERKSKSCACAGVEQKVYDYSDEAVRGMLLPPGVVPDCVDPCKVGKDIAS